MLTVVSFNENVSLKVLHAEQKLVKYTDLKQVTCLANNIFYEAGKEPIIGQAAVARVVVNRMISGFGNTPCQVIYQSTVVQKDDTETKVCQFSWVCEEGKGNPNTHTQTYQTSLQVAYDVLVLDKYKDVISKDILYFHNNSVEQDSEYYAKVKRIGNHIFYSRKPHRNHDKYKTTHSQE
jgi:spore germination cell wall hydrolase CwlJ-like protein